MSCREHDLVDIRRALSHGIDRPKEETMNVREAMSAFSTHFSDAIRRAAVMPTAVCGSAI
jgi:hypothetical protein